MALRHITVRIEGETPLLMHNARLANPLNSYAKRLSELSKSKKRKGADTDAILMEMADVEWEGGLYYDEKLGPVIPTMMIKACIIEGAKLTRGGRNVERTVTLAGQHIKLQYDGPRSMDALRKDERYRDQRMVGVAAVKVLRTRPLFSGWSLEFDVTYNTEGMEEQDLLRYIRDAGMFEGIGDGRGKLNFGRFNITHVNGQPHSPTYEDESAQAG